MRYTYLYMFFVLLIISILIYLNVNQAEKDKLLEQISSCESDLEIVENSYHYELERNVDEYNKEFDRDCRLRGYLYYDDDKEGSYCCKWVNESRVCASWITVMTEQPIQVNPYDYLSEKENVTILFEKDGGSLEILIDDPDIYFCDAYEYNEVQRIRCS